MTITSSQVVMYISVVDGVRGVHVHKQPRDLI